MDPLAADQVKRTRRYSKTSVQYLNENELDALFRAVKEFGSTPAVQARDFAIFELAYHRGLRASEVRMLQLSDFNQAARTLFVHRLKGGNSGEYVVTDREFNALTAHLAHRGPAAGALFHSRNGKPISRQRLHEMINAYGAACGLVESKRHFHCMRHTAGTMLIEQADVELVQDHLGHRDIRSTLVYAKVRNKRRRELGVRMAKEW